MRVHAGGRPIPVLLEAMTNPVFVKGKMVPRHFSKIFWLALERMPGARPMASEACKQRVDVILRLSHKLKLGLILIKLRGFLRNREFLEAATLRVLRFLEAGP